MARASRTLEAAPTSRDDVAFWLYSSGSTGRPKGAVHLHHDMVIAAETYAKQVLGFRPTDKVYSAAKLFFAYGLGNAGYFPMSVGAQSVLYPHRPTPGRRLRAARRATAPRSFFGVPTLYAAMLAAKDARSGSISRPSVSACRPARPCRPTSTAGGASASAWRSSTASARPRAATSSCRTARARCDRGRRAFPSPATSARSSTTRGDRCRAGEIGNLRVRGDSTMAYYWNKHDKTKETLFGPWIQTGDKYHQDADGYFWYDGRGDDMLKVGGIWVSPVEVEATLIQHPAVLEVAVVGQRGRRPAGQAPRLRRPQGPGRRLGGAGRASSAPS